MVNLKPANKKDQQTLTVNRRGSHRQWLFVLASILLHGLFLLLFVAYQRLQPVVEEKPEENKPIDFVVIPEKESEEPPEPDILAQENSVAQNSTESEETTDDKASNEVAPSTLEKPIPEETTALSPEPKPIPEPLPEPELLPELEPLPELEANTDVPLTKLPKPLPELEPLPESLPEPELEPLPESEPEPEPEANTDVPLTKLPKPEPELEPEPESLPELKPLPEPSTDVPLTKLPKPEPEPEPETIPQPDPESSVATNSPPTQPELPQTTTAPSPPNRDDGGASALLGGDYQQSLANGGGDAFFSEEALTYKSVLSPSQLNALKDIDLSVYSAEMRRITQNWNPSYRAEAYTTILTFNIEKNGQITGLRVIESSGSPEIDRESLEAVQKSAPFAPLPPEFPLEALEVRFSFEYFY